MNYIVDGLFNQVNPTFSNLFAGTYEVVAQDEFGCKDTLDVTINQELEIILNIDNVVGVVCNTTNTGAIEVTPTGGVVGLMLMEW